MTTRRTIGLASLVLVAVAAPAVAQPSVVAAVRAAHPQLPNNPAVTHAALREIAFRVKGGLYVKTTGNQCLGYSCDIICFADGRLVDVFGDWEGAASPQWTSAGLGEPGRCELVTIDPGPTPGPAPGPGPTPAPTPPPTDPALEAILAEIQAVNAKLTLLLAQQAQRDAELRAALQELQRQVAAGVRIRF